MQDRSIVILSILRRNPAFTMLLAAVVIAALSRALGPVTSLTGWPMALLAAAVALAGLPHGAADAWIAGHKGLARTPLRILAFLLGYLGLSIMVILVWRMAPVASLAAFLALSVWHFGDDRAIGYGVVARIATGLVILCAPAAFAPASVASVYRVLSGDSAAALIELQRLLLGPAWLTLACHTLLESLRQERRLRAMAHMTEISLLVALSLLTEPLIYFSFYFCLLHSPRHLARILASWRLAPDRRFWPSTLIVCMVSALAGVIAFVGLLDGGQKLEYATLQVVFIGLAALSLPHILLVDCLLARGKAFR